MALVCNGTPVKKVICNGVEVEKMFIGDEQVFASWDGKIVGDLVNFPYKSYEFTHIDSYYGILSSAYGEPTVDADRITVRLSDISDGRCVIGIHVDDTAQFNKLLMSGSIHAYTGNGYTAEGTIYILMSEKYIDVSTESLLGNCIGHFNSNDLDTTDNGKFELQTDCLVGEMYIYISFIYQCIPSGTATLVIDQLELQDW